MTEMITYRGGCCGDFLRLLISNCYYEIDVTGKVINSDVHDFTRGVIPKIQNGDDFKEIVKDVLYYKSIPNRRIDYVSSHDLYLFYERYGNLDLFFKYIDIIDIKRLLYISISTENSIKYRTLNSMIKNHGKTTNDFKVFFDKYSLYQLEDYRNEKKLYLDSKRDCDIIIELECIYDKEYLRNFLKNNYDGWSDTNFDAVYDEYMSKQPSIGD